MATPVAVALVAASPVLPFTSVLFGHLLAALFVTLAWSRARTGADGWGDAAWAGGWLGLGIGTEYTVAIPALGMLLVVLAARRWGSALAMSATTVAAVIPLLVYNWLTFENPFETAYQGHLPYFEGAGAGGVYNLQTPRFDEIVRALVGDRGLFTLTPVMLFAAVGCVWVIRERLPARLDAWLAIGSLAVMVVASTGIDGYGGASSGPRYLIPILPLFALPLAEAWRRRPSWCAAAAVMGALSMVVATITGPLRGPGPPLRGWYDDVLHGRVADNVFTGGTSDWIVYLGAGLAIALTFAALRLARTTTASDG